MAIYKQMSALELAVVRGLSWMAPFLPRYIDFLWRPSRVAPMTERMVDSFKTLDCINGEKIIHSLLASELLLNRILIW